MTLIACLASAYRHERRRSAMLLALGTWALSILLASPILFAYAVDYSLATDAFVGACLASSTIAYLLCRNLPRPAPSSYVKRPQELRGATMLGVAGALGSLLLLADAYSDKGLQLSVSYLLDNLSSIRTDNFDTLASGTSGGSILQTIGTLMAPCAVLTVIAAVKFGHENGHRLQLLAALNFALMAAVSLMIYAGRATIANLTIIALISLYLTGRRMSLLRPRTFIIGAMMLICVWYFSTSWLGTREKDPNAIAILEGTQRATTRPWLRTTSDHNQAIGLAVVSVGYFASPLPTLAFYIQQKPIPGPYYGAYSYPLPARFLGTLAGTWNPGQWIATRREIYAPIEARNYFGNVWATWLRDLLVDFGYLGAWLFCALFGAFMAWARNGYEATGALHYHYLEVLACFTLAFGAFTSFLWFPFVALPFFVAIWVMVALRVHPIPRSQRRTSSA